MDGPLHFTSNTLQAMGTSLLRLRLLRALGWRVVAVPFYEWCQLEDGKRGKVCCAQLCSHRVYYMRRQMDYLARKLKNMEGDGDPQPPPPHIVAAAMRAHRKQQEGFLLGVATDLPAATVLAGSPPPAREVESDEEGPVAGPRTRGALQSKGKQRRVPKDVGVRRNPLGLAGGAGEQGKGEGQGKGPRKQGRRRGGDGQ